MKKPGNLQAICSSLLILYRDSIYRQE